MTEEQITLEKEKIALLKRIADALDRAFPNLVIKSKSEVDLDELRNALKMGCNSIYGAPTRFVTESEKPEEIWK